MVNVLDSLKTSRFSKLEEKKVEVENLKFCAVKHEANAVITPCLNTVISEHSGTS